MAKRGRKPHPTALKILAGAQPCRINRDDPVVPEGVPDPPGRLSSYALEFWQEVAPILAAMGILTLADRQSLALLCDSFQRYREDSDDHKRREEFRKLLAEFGLTPSSRSAIKMPAKPPADPLADFLKKA